MSDWLRVQFEQSFAKRERELYSLSAAQRIRLHIFTQQNMRALVSLQSNVNTVFSLPYEAALCLGLNPFAARCASIRFGFDVVKISLPRVLRAAFFIFRAGGSVGKPQEKFSVYLIDVSLSALNRSADSGAGHTLENWLRANYMPKDGVIFHSINHQDLPDNRCREYTANFLPFIPLGLRCILLGSVILRTICYLVALLAGRWQNLFMLDDWMFSEIFRMANADAVHDRYIFVFQGSQYRPHWSYVAEQKGGLAVQLNYAANTVPSLDCVYQDRDGIETATWNEIIPFSADFKPFIERINECRPLSPSVISARPVFFNDNLELPLPRFECPVIALFDTPHLDERFHIGWTDHHEYLETDNVDEAYLNKKFVMDVVSAAKTHGMQVVMKQKRHDTRVLQSYTAMLEDFSSSNDIVMLPPEVAPSRVIANYCGCIVPPFSSVGYLYDYNSNICFYDVAGKFLGEHETALTVSLVSNFDDLSLWLAEISKTTRCSVQ